MTSLRLAIEVHHFADFSFPLPAPFFFSNIEQRRRALNPRSLITQGLRQ